MLDAARRLVRQIARTPFYWHARLRDWSSARPGRHELAICAIFREEAPFLKEWIEFHRGVGVGHFYLYNNFSTDDFEAVLQPFIDSGLVTLTDWPVAVGQVPAYRDCIAKHWRHARWIAFIDIDEFLFSPQQTDIVPILARYRHLPAIHVWQAFYGSSGHVSRPEGPLVEAYTRRAPLTRTTVKTIANPRMIYKPDVHISKYWIGESRDTAGRTHAADLPPVLDVLRINHYWSRSIDDLHQKVRRGDASTANPRRLDWHLEFERTLNAEEDESILGVRGKFGVRFFLLPVTMRGEGAPRGRMRDGANARRLLPAPHCPAGHLSPYDDGERDAVIDRFANRRFDSHPSTC